MPIPPSLPNPYFSLDAGNYSSYPGSGSTWIDPVNNIQVSLSGPTSFSLDGGGSITFATSATGSFPVNANFPTGADPVSISMWIKFNQLPQSFQDPLFVIGNPAANGCHFLFLIPDGGIGFSGNIVYDMAGPLRADYGPLYSVDGEFHLLTTTYDGNTMKSYWDGQFIPNSNFSNVGALSSYSTGYFGFFNGNSAHASYSISEVNLFDVGLSALQVLNLYNSGLPRYEKVVSYDFSDPLCYPGTGNTVFDLSGSEIDLPIVNATFGGTGQSKYFSFNGTNTLIGKNGVTGLGNTFSVSMWAQYPAAATSQMFAFSAGTYSASNGAGPQSSITSTVIDFSFNDGIGATSFATSPDVWHYYTFTNDGTTTKGYKDGVLAGSVSQGVGSWDTGGLYLGVPISTSGNYYPGFYFDGKIAIFDVYNTALGSTDVTTIYNNEVSRFGSPPPAYSGIVGGRQFAQGFNG